MENLDNNIPRTPFVCEYDYTSQPMGRKHITKEAKGCSPNNIEITEEEYQKALREFTTKYTDVEKFNDLTQQVNNSMWCFNYDGDVYFCLVLNGGLNAEQIYYGLQRKKIL